MSDLEHNDEPASNAQLRPPERPGASQKPPRRGRPMPRRRAGLRRPALEAAQPAGENTPAKSIEMASSGFSSPESVPDAGGRVMANKQSRPEEITHPKDDSVPAVPTVPQAPGFVNLAVSQPHLKGFEPLAAGQPAPAAPARSDCPPQIPRTEPVGATPGPPKSLRWVIDQVKQIHDNLNSVLADVEEVLEVLDEVEASQAATDQEIEQLRRSLKALQNPNRSARPQPGRRDRGAMRDDRGHRDPRRFHEPRDPRPPGHSHPMNDQPPPIEPPQP